MKKFLVYCFIAITSILSSCGVTDTEEKSQPGRRDYVWSVDTITVPKITFRSIWGETPNNIFIVAPGYGTYAEKLYHFNGNKWDMLRISNIEWDPTCVIGSSDNTLFFGDYKGMIYRYDSQNLKLDYTYPETINTYANYIQMMCKGKNDEIFAIFQASYNSSTSVLNVVLKYDGEKWYSFFSIVSNWSFSTIKYLNNKLYLVGENLQDEPKYLFELSDGKLKKIKEVLGTGTFLNINLINGKLYAITKGLLERYNGNMFLPVIVFDKDLAYYASGRNEKDIFLTGYNGIYHYDGNDIKTLYKLPFYEFILMNDPLIFEDEIFVYGESIANWGQNIIIHGKI